jgi:spermidine/putrescine transport system substrate-binding protein
MKIRFVLIVLIVSSMLAACSRTPALAPSPTAPALAEKITFYNWPDDVPQSILDRFKAETGVEVEYLTYESMEEAVENLENGREVCVANLDSRFFPEMLKSRLILPLQQEYLPNLKNISPNFRELVFDPGNRYSVPYNWGVTDLIYRKDLTARPLTSWADLWNLPTGQKAVLYKGEMREIIGITLKSLGYPANSEDPAQLEAARHQLLKIKPDVIFPEDADQASMGPALVAGQAAAGPGFAYDLVSAAKENDQINFVAPIEGALLWFENFIIPSTCTQPYTAHVFLNYILRAETAANIANENFYATPNENALTLIDPALKENLIVFPASDVVEKAELIVPVSEPAMKIYNAIWEEFTRP